MVDPRRAIRDETSLPEAPREWLVANGLGGYASATITGAITRRYHGFLIAAQPAPLGRMVVLNDLEVDIELADGSVVNMREKGRFLDFTLNMGHFTATEVTRSSVTCSQQEAAPITTPSV